MGLDIEGAVVGAVGRLRSREALYGAIALFVGLVVLSLGSVLTGSLSNVVRTAGAVVLLGGVVLFTVGQLFAYRLCFAADDAGGHGSLTRRLGRGTLWLLVTNLVVWVAVGAGLAAFVLPGIFIALSAVLAFPMVAIDDVGMFTALERAWQRSKAHRVELLVLGLVSVGVSMGGRVVNFAIEVAVAITAAIGAAVAPGVAGVLGLVVGLLGLLLTAAVSAVALLVITALQVEAYAQVSADGGARGDTSASSGPDPSGYV